ncbi:hypothetical protein KR200_002193 [Drosophila serrata]|nr:hypothetical protein KR200_002193 [Drosophila serrata]
MPTSLLWPHTRLNWKRALLFSLECVYLLMMVTLSRQTAGMAVNSSLAQQHRRSFLEGTAAAAYT